MKLMRLETKEQRKNARLAWIGEKQTEIYKDVEILTDEKNYNGINHYSLVVWRGQAGNPFANYTYRTTEQRQRAITEYKNYADSREKWHQQNADNRGKVVTQAAKASQRIKEILKREYPDVKFSVRSDNFANGSSVDVYWTDGIPEKDLKTFLSQFEYGHFDGMTDCYNYDNNKEGMPQAKYVFGKRTVSVEKEKLIQAQLAEKMGIVDDGNSVIPPDYQTGRSQYLSNMVYQIAYGFDFRKGFIGVRNARTETGEIITNRFELY